MQRVDERISILSQMGDSLTLYADPQKVLDSIVSLTSRLLKVSTCSLILLEGDGRLKMKAACGVPRRVVEGACYVPDESISGWVARERKPLLIDDIEHHPVFCRLNRRHYRTKSLLSVPLMLYDKEVVGVLNVNNKRSGGTFTEEDGHLLSIVANQMTIIVKNAEMQSLLVEKRLLDQQLELAKTLQQGILPRNFPKREDFDCVAVNFPAMMIGGDLYDVREVDRERMAVVVGDISGKGIPASLFMVRLLSEFRSQLHLRRSPSTVMTRLNEMVKKESMTGMFVTFVYFLLDIEKGRLTYANAGHPPPLVYSSRSGKVVRLNGAKTIPLGVSAGTVFRNKTIPIESRDTLLMYTDGVIEAQNEKGEYFGIGRLEEILKRSHSSASYLVEELLAQLEQFTGGSRNQDDSTLVAVKVF